MTNVQVLARQPQLRGTKKFQISAMPRVPATISPNQRVSFERTNEFEIRAIAEKP